MGREADCAARVADEQIQRAAADRLRQSLGAQVCRADGVGLADDVRASILVAGDGQRQAESEKQPDNAEQRSLQDPKRLSEALRKVPNAVAQENPETRRAEDNGKEKEAQLQACEPKKDDPTLVRHRGVQRSSHRGDVRQHWPVNDASARSQGPTRTC